MARAIGITAIVTCGLIFLVEREKNAKVLLYGANITFKLYYISMCLKMFAMMIQYGIYFSIVNLYLIFDILHLKLEIEVG